MPNIPSSIAKKGTRFSKTEFLCTLCWQQQNSGTCPKLLGGSARIICESCWRAVLDLSICWACGEIICRGDEVISLGWCFWHHSCFGCLICRKPIKWPSSNTSGNQRMSEYASKGNEWNGRGIELESIPLCKTCEMETGIEKGGEKKEQILEKSRDTISRFDGGLSQYRAQLLEMSQAREPVKMEAQGNDIESKVIVSKPSRGNSNPQAEPIDVLHSGHGFKTTARDFEKIDSYFEKKGSEKKQICDISRPSSEKQEDIYLSIYDPLGEPAFVPSRTKPLPKWMQLLPKTVYKDRERMAQEIHKEEKHEVDGSRIVGNVPRGDRKKSQPKTLQVPASFNPELRKRINLDEMSVQGSTRAPTNSKPSVYPYLKSSSDSNTRSMINQHDLELHTSHYLSDVPSSGNYKNSVGPNRPLHAKHKGPLDISPQLDFDIPLYGTRPPIISRSSEYLEKFKPETTSKLAIQPVTKPPEPILTKMKKERVVNKTVRYVASMTSIT